MGARGGANIETIALFGKGGSGKSTVATNLSYLYARRGLRVLHVGCDPKRDSTLRLLGRRAPLGMVDLDFSKDARRAVLEAPCGVHCVETGGPPPGIGCAGRGVILTMENFERLRLLQDDAYDVAVFDVLGDLVCGGFAAPLSRGIVKKVAIVLSDEPMSVFAANNIARMTAAYTSRGVALAGLIGNSRDDGRSAEATLRRVARRLRTRLLAHFRRDPLIRRAERARQTVAQFAPRAPVTRRFAALADDLLRLRPAELKRPAPLNDAALDRFLEELDGG